MRRMIYGCGFLPKNHDPRVDWKRPGLEALVAAIESADERQPEVDEALVEQLRALGYVE